MKSVGNLIGIREQATDLFPVLLMVSISTCFLDFARASAPSLELKGKTQLHIEQRIFVEELPKDIGESDRITLTQGGKYIVFAEENSLLRIDYRHGEDFVDLFYPKTIILNPNTLVPLVYKMEPNPNRQHYKNAQLTVKGRTKIEYPRRYKGRVIASGPSGATLIRSLTDNALTLVQGEAYIGHVDFEREGTNTSEPSTEPEPKVKKVFVGGTGNLNFNQKVGPTHLASEEIQKRVTSKKTLTENHPVNVSGLPEDYDSGKSIMIGKDEDNAIRVGQGSLVRVDYEDDQDYFDVFFPEYIVIAKDTFVPLRFKLYFGPDQPHWRESNFTAGDEFRLSFPPDYKGTAVYSGAMEAKMKRRPGSRMLELIEGEAYLVEF